MSNGGKKSAADFWLSKLRIKIVRLWQRGGVEFSLKTLKGLYLERKKDGSALAVEDKLFDIGGMVVLG